MTGRTAHNDTNPYDVIIIGAGASGLMCAASPAWVQSGNKGPGNPKWLVLEGGRRCGLKLLMSGGGHCNITHEGNMRDLLGAYGDAGKALRTVLYKYGNRDSMQFLKQAGVPLYADETGRVLPVSMQAQDVLDAYLKAASQNGFAVCREERVTAIGEQDSIYCIHTESHSFLARKIVIATGGCSYPTTGSDGAMFEVLRRDLGITVSPLSPALVPVIPEEYPYEELAGISLPHVRVSIHRDGQKSVHREGALLFTHGAFSGPCALDISSHAARGSRIALSYIHPMTFDDAYAAIRAQGLRTGKAVAAAFALPKRLAALLVQRAADSPKRLAHLLTEDTFVVKDTEGFKTAMVTKGGAVLSQIHMTTMELKDHPGIYIIGEALDADAISGGYNLQLCWSTAQAAAFAAAAEVR